MNAIQFIKENGVDKVREVVERSSFGTHYKVDTGEIICCHNEDHFYFVDQLKLGVEFIRINNLKRLVESVDLIIELGGIEKSRGYVQVCFFKGRDRYANRLKQAIADYEAIYSGVGK